MSDNIMSNINTLWIQVTSHGYHKVSDLVPTSLRILGFWGWLVPRRHFVTTTQQRRSHVAAMNNEPSSNLSRTRNAGMW